MLQAIRDRLTGIVAFVILGILALAFALFGIQNYFTATPDNTVAVVNDEIITEAEYQSSFQAFLSNQANRFGQSFDIAQFDQPSVRRQHLDSMINQRVVQQQAKEMGLAVSDQELQSYIASLPAFQVNGEFNSAVYLSALRSNAQTPDSFANDVALSLITQQINQAVRTSTFATDTEVAEMARLQNQTRNFRAVQFPAANEVEVPEVTEEEISAYYESNQSQFFSEEQLVINYLEVSIDQYREDINVTEDELRESFESAQQRYINPEERLASHILINVPQGADEAAENAAQTLAQSLADRARAGEDFATLAQENSDDAGSAPNGGDLGWITPTSAMVDEFIKGLFELSADGISDPIRSGFGYHVIQLRDIRESSGMTFEEARAEIERELIEDRALTRFLEESGKIIDQAYASTRDLQAAADQAGVELQQEGPFGRSGGFGVAGYPEVVDEAFSEDALDDGRNVVAEVANNHFVLINVNQRIESSLKPLEEVRPEIITILESEHRSNAARARAESWLAQIAEGADIAGLAQENEAVLINGLNASRRSFEYDRALLAEVFRLPTTPENQRAYHVVAVNNDYALVELGQTSDGAIEENDPLRFQFFSQISNTFAVEEANSIVELLRSQAEVTVFEDRI